MDDTELLKFIHGRIDRNWEYVPDFDSPCWKYNSGRRKESKSVPQINWKGNILKVHKLLYHEKFGIDIQTYRRCCNPKCVNPDHMTTYKAGSPNTQKPIRVIDGVMSKECSKCGNVYPFTQEFYDRTKKGLKAYCKDCRLAKQRSRREKNWVQILLNNMGSRNIEIGIDASYIRYLYKKQKGLCFWLGIPMVPSKKPRDLYQPSVDRLDRDLGYVENNVVLCSFAANFGRNQATVEEWIRFLSDIPESFSSALWRDYYA